MSASATFGASLMRAALWGTRAAIVALGLLAWRYHAAESFAGWFVVGGSIAALLFVHQLLRRQVLGWFTDAHGERQKAEGVNRDSVVYTPTTRSKRIVEEVSERSDRRKTLLWSTPVVGGLVYFAIRARQDGSTEFFWASVFFAALFSIVWLPALAREVLYLVGYQDLKGAKVLDPAPRRPGIGDVERQKVHGNASLASEDEAADLLNPRR
jgi:hypothetical protein